ncbi:MAG: EamA family transporter [Melioribacteraceae bacterium]
MNKKNLTAYLAWVTICIVWGTTFLAIKIGVESLPPMLFAGIRWIIAGPILLLVLYIKGIKLPQKKDFKHLAIIGILLIGGGNGFVVIGEQWLPSGLASLLITTLPFWIVSIEYLIPNSYKLNKFMILGLVVGFFGVSLIFWNELENLLNGNYFWGIVSVLAAVICWSTGSLYSKYKPIGSHPLMNASWQMIIAGTLQISIGLFLGEQNSFSLNTDGVLAMLYLVFIGSLLGYTSYIYAISKLPVSFVTTYAYVNPVIALLLGWMVLDERINFTLIIAMLIILAGVALVQFGNFKKVKV